MPLIYRTQDNVQHGYNNVEFLMVNVGWLQLLREQWSTSYGTKRHWALPGKSISWAAQKQDALRKQFGAAQIVPDPSTFVTFWESGLRQAR